MTLDDLLRLESQLAGARERARELADDALVDLIGESLVDVSRWVLELQTKHRTAPAARSRRGHLRILRGGTT